MIAPGFSNVMMPVPLPQSKFAHVVDVRLMVLIRMLPVLDRLTFTITSVSAANQAAAHGPNRGNSTVWVVMVHYKTSIPTCLQMQKAIPAASRPFTTALVQDISRPAPKLNHGNWQACLQLTTTRDWY